MQFNIANSYNKIKEAAILHGVMRMELKNAASASDGEGERAFYAQPSDSQRIFCSYCKMKGHTIDNCWTKHKHLRPHKESHSYQNSNENNKRENKGKGVNRAFLTQYALVIAPIDNPCAWYVDSGATSHMSPCRSFFSKFRHIPPISIKIADKSSIHATGLGDHIIDLEDVLFVPRLATGLFSVRQASNDGISTLFREYDCIITPLSLPPIPIDKQDGLYQLVIQPVSMVEEAALLTSPIQLWHERLGHIDPKRIANITATGEQINDTDYFQCLTCLQGKATAKAIHTSPLPRSSINV
jgi:hypothetical protein